MSANRWQLSACRRRSPGADLERPWRGALQAWPPFNSTKLQLLLDTCPAAWGRTDQCWMLPRIAAVACERLVWTIPPGRYLLLHRVGVECVGARPARGRERRGTDQGPAGGELARDKGTVANLGAWEVFEDGSGETLRPPKRAHLGSRVARGRRGDSCRWLRWWRRGPAIGRG